MDYFFPLLPLLLRLTKHIRAAHIWAEFKISQRGCRVNMSAIGKPALPDWRNFCPANEQRSKLAAQNLTSLQTSPESCFGPPEEGTRWANPVPSLQVPLLLPTCSYTQQVGRSIAFLWAGRWWPHGGLPSGPWGLLYPIGEASKVKEAKRAVGFKWFHVCHRSDNALSTFVGEGVTHVASCWVHWLGLWNCSVCNLRLHSSSSWRLHFKRKCLCFEMGSSQSSAFPFRDRACAGLSASNLICLYLLFPV